MSIPEQKSCEMFGDQEIRDILIKRLRGLSKTPKAILEELRVHNGNAIADVVSVHNYAHCYEIKSDSDSIERAQDQAKYYDLVFRKVTLVTTQRHLDKAVKLVPEHWGILIIKRSKNDSAKLTYFRSARFSPSFNKQLALLTLWKSELTAASLLGSLHNVNKLNRSNLCDILAKEFDLHDVSKYIGDQLISRSFKSTYPESCR